jgi:hypothetical protein
MLNQGSGTVKESLRIRRGKDRSRHRRRLVELALARMFHELMSRNREDGGATGQPQGLGPKAYLTVPRKVSLF